MRILTLALFLLFPLSLQAATLETEEKIFGAFQNYCLSLQGDHQKINEAMVETDIKELPAELARKFTAPYEGHAWLLGKKDLSFVLSVTQKSTCSVSALGKASGEKTKKLLIGALNAPQIDQDKTITAINSLEINKEKDQIMVYEYFKADDLEEYTYQPLIAVTTNALKDDFVVLNAINQKADMLEYTGWDELE